MSFIEVYRNWQELRNTHIVQVFSCQLLALLVVKADINFSRNVRLLFGLMEYDNSVPVKVKYIRNLFLLGGS